MEIFLVLVRISGSLWDTKFYSLSVYYLFLVHQIVHMSVNSCLFLFCCLNDCCSVFHVEKKCLKLYLLAVHPLICFNLFKRQSHFGKQKLIINTAPWLGSKYSWERSARGWLSTQAALKGANRFLLETVSLKLVTRGWSHSKQHVAWANSGKQVFKDTSKLG